MPTRITRYILLEVVKIFSISLVVLTMLILLIGIGRELLREGLGVMAVISLLPYVLPVSLQYSIPVTVLFAVCCVYGRMAADGELSTIKSAGVSPFRVMQPALIFAALLSPVTVLLSDLAVSWGEPGVKRVIIHSVEDVVYRMLQAQKSYSSPKGFSIYVHDVDGKRLIFPEVTLNSGGSGETVTMKALEAGISLDPETATLILTTVDCRVELGDKSDTVEWPGRADFPIPLDMVLRKGSVDISKPSELPLSIIALETVRQQRTTEANRRRLAAQTGFSLISARWDELAGPKGNVLQGEIAAGEGRLIRLRTEPWRRWSIGFSCFFFVWVGIPLAIRMKSADYWTSFGMCFVPILLFYYPLFQLGIDQAKSGEMPPYSVWLANACMAVVGGYLCKYVYRY